MRDHGRAAKAFAVGLLRRWWVFSVGFGLAAANAAREVGWLPWEVRTASPVLGGSFAAGFALAAYLTFYDNYPKLRTRETLARLVVLHQRGSELAHMVSVVARDGNHNMSSLYAQAEKWLYQVVTVLDKGAADLTSVFTDDSFQTGLVGMEVQIEAARIEGRHLGTLLKSKAQQLESICDAIRAGDESN